MKRTPGRLPPRYGTTVLSLVLTLVTPMAGVGQSGSEARSTDAVRNRPKASCPLAANRASSVPAGTATVTLSGAGYDQTITYVGGENLVFCVRTSDTMLWIRLAEAPGGDGEQGPHLDIDLCHVAGSATFTPMNPRGQPCPGGRTRRIWWHDGPAVAYANRPDSSPCQLVLTVEADVFAATFECRGLVNQDGTGSLDILDGSFQQIQRRQGQSESPCDKCSASDIVVRQLEPQSVG